MPDDKTLTHLNAEAAKQAGVSIFGNHDLWTLVGKAYHQTEGWMKSTKVMEMAKGCILQTTTQQRNLNGSYSLTDSLVYVPGATKKDFPIPEPVKVRPLATVEEVVTVTEDLKIEEKPAEPAPKKAAKK